MAGVILPNGLNSHIKSGDYLMRRLFFDNRGSVTLEATVIFPFFVVLMVLLVNFIKLTSIYLAMDHAVSETVKQIAVHSYPLKYMNSGKLHPDIQAEGFGVINEMAAALTAEAGQAVLPEAARAIALAKLQQMYPLNNYTELGLRITQIKAYNPLRSQGMTVNGITLTGEDIALRVEYKVRLPVPFFPFKEITLSSTAAERAWVDG